MVQIKKTTFISFIFILALSIFMPIFLPEVNAAGPYRVKMVNSSGTDTDLGTFPTYNEALTKANAQNSTDTSVATIFYNETKIVYAKYAIAKVNVSKAPTINVYQDNDKAYSYISPTYASDSAYISHDSYTGYSEILISGLRGWVHVDNVDIIPISRLNKSTTRVKITATTSLNVRTDPHTGATVVGGTQTGQIYSYTEEKTGEGYTWYKIAYGGGYYWIASGGNDWVQKVTTTQNLDTYYQVSDNGDMQHVFHSNEFNIATLTIGKAPSYLQKDIRYWSFDGNYFYTSLKTMLDDYRNKNRNNALNKDKPYFAYYQYLPSHSKSGYTAANFDNIVKQWGFTAQPATNITYVNSSCVWNGTNRSGLSKMYGTGASFIKAQEQYSINALQAFSKATSESDYGKSAIAFLKNNLFGIGAVDANPCGGAHTYANPEASIIAFAQTLGGGSGYSGGYNDPWDSRYAGGHYGNKGSGLNVKYAGDPYWGEKQSAISYALDKTFGGMDNNSNTLGIKLSGNPIIIYKNASSTSTEIYRAQNYNITNFLIPNMAFIVTDKVYVTENGKSVGYYKVYTDPTLNSNRVVDMRGQYSFNNSWGWIKETDLYVENKQPTITNTVITAKQSEKITDYSKFITVNDAEDGKITNFTVDDKNVEWNKIGTYTVTITATDKQKFSVSKTVDLTITLPDAPIIIVSGGNIVASQHTPKDNIDFLADVLVTDADTNIMSKLTFTTNVNTAVIGTYTVTYSATNSKGRTTTQNRTITVIANKVPVINASNKTIKIGSSFNPIEGISAIDPEDGDITNKVTHSGNVNTAVAGDYNVTYTVKDNHNNQSTKTIVVTVSSTIFTNKTGTFYLHELKYDSNTKKLNFSGFHIVKGVNNIVTTVATNELILINQITKQEVIIKLDKWLTEVPFTIPSESGFNQSGSWFKSSIDLKEIPAGDYTMKIRTIIGTNQSTSDITNPYFNENITTKFNSENRGYFIRTNTTIRTMNIDLIVRDKVLPTTTINPTTDNMRNQFYSVSFNGNNMKLMGTSHNTKGNYAKTVAVERWIYFENVATNEIFRTFNIGFIDNGPITVRLPVSDGFDKTRTWYDAAMDISSLPKGRYAILIRTKTGSIDDHGEVYDYQFEKITASATINNKNYRVVRNDTVRFRLELIVE